MKNIEWVRLRAYVTGLVNHQLLLRNEYLAAENRILRAQLPKRLRLTDFSDAIAIDASGNVYITGSRPPPIFPSAPVLPDAL